MYSTARGGRALPFLSSAGVGLLCGWDGDECFAGVVYNLRENGVCMGRGDAGRMRVLWRWKAVAGFGAAGLLALVGGVRPARAAVPVPAVSISLEDLGFQAISNRYLLAGDAMFTLHFVDAKHLLVTFSNHSLITRKADAEPGDQDHNVTALLVEIATGKTVARTEWQLRDHARYLWPLGHGRFLLRIRGRLTVLSPVANHAGGQAFKQEPFAVVDRQILHVEVAPEGDLLLVESAVREKVVVKIFGGAASAAALAVAQGVAPPEPPKAAKRELAREARVHLDFFRLLMESGERMVVQAAGSVRSREPLDVAVTSEGYLDVKRESERVWLFDFQAHGGGKRLELSPFDTSCAPRARFVSGGEFVAFGCRGSADKQQMAGFNLKGEENWINVFAGQHLFPFVIAAPAAGRFLLSRTVVTGTYVDAENLVAEQISGQEVTVMQSADGRQLLKLQAAPFQRAGQNVDLAADGLSVAIMRTDKIEVYRLPPLTTKDLGEIREARRMVPGKNVAKIDLGGKLVTVVAEREPVEAEVPAAAPVAVAAPVEVAVPAAVAKVPEADGTEVPGAGDGGPRKPPTLYDAEHPKKPQ